MTVYESELTPGNLKYAHIYITPFLDKLPPDVFGGTNVHAPAPRRVRLEFDTLCTDTFVTTDMEGKPRSFFQDRAFVRDFFARKGANPGDVVRFEEVTPYHFHLSLKPAAGKVIAT
ncbi:hypothetical protein [Castellaniella sp.]|uniref:hypothetical protein n=1 Tax=Castellaniella sp. TaxID=1955812 RepID=UPI002AFF4961|nr:hypothetical protein [Castellaniella sp.]